MAKTPGRSNLLVEARAVAALPSVVGYPEVLGSGVEEDHEWMATARLAGDNLGACWPRLDAAERERAIIDLCLRVDAIGSTPLDGLPNLDPSPFYRLDRLQAATLSPTFLPVVGRSMVHRLHTPGAAERIRAYAVLRDTWALRGWIANWPQRRNIHDWEPTRRLRSIADGTSWVTTLLSG